MMHSTVTRERERELYRYYSSSSSCCFVLARPSNPYCCAVHPPCKSLLLYAGDRVCHCWGCGHVVILKIYHAHHAQGHLIDKLEFPACGDCGGL